MGPLPRMGTAGLAFDTISDGVGAPESQATADFQGQPRAQLPKLLAAT